MSPSEHSLGTAVLSETQRITKFLTSCDILTAVITSTCLRKLVHVCVSVCVCVSVRVMRYNNNPLLWQ